MDLIDLLYSDGGLARYSPPVNSSAFSQASDTLTDCPTIPSEELVKGDKQHYAVGDNGSEDLALENYGASSCCEKKRPFMGKHGSIGPNGTFPYVSKYPEVDNSLDEDVKEECFGVNADTTASIDENTYITIGKTGGPENCSPLCNANVKALEIVSPNPNFVKLEGSFQQIEGNTAYFHQGKDMSILITAHEVQVWPGLNRRTLNIYPCTSDFKRYENTPTNSQAFFKDIAYSDESFTCVAKICSLSNSHHISQFTHLIERQDPLPTSSNLPPVPNPNSAPAFPIPIS